jgi:hypothetical protein
LDLCWINIEGEKEKIKNNFFHLLPWRNAESCYEILFLFQEVMRSNVDVSDGTRSRQYISSSKQLKVD